jgi:hypothetical protein
MFSKVFDITSYEETFYGLSKQFDILNTRFLIQVFQERISYISVTLMYPMNSKEQFFDAVDQYKDDLFVLFGCESIRIKINRLTHCTKNWLITDHYILYGKFAVMSSIKFEAKRLTTIVVELDTRTDPTFETLKEKLESDIKFTKFINHSIVEFTSNEESYHDCLETKILSFSYKSSNEGKMNIYLTACVFPTIWIDYYYGYLI